MGSPLAPLLIDATLMLVSSFSKKIDVQPFFEFINNFHEGISFTKEESTFFPFLYVKMTKTVNGFVTSTFYKLTHTRLYTDWNSFTPRKYKFKTLLPEHGISVQTKNFSNTIARPSRII